MEQKCDRLYPSAPLENNDSEQRLEKKLNDVNSFNNHIKNIKEMIIYFKYKNSKSKKRYKNYKTLSTVLESGDSIDIIGATSTSITLPITDVVLIIFKKSPGTACTLSLGYKVRHEIIINKYKKNKKQYEKDQQRNKSFDKFSENLYKIIFSIKLNMKIYVMFLLKMLMKKKRIFFINMNIKKVKLFQS